MKAQFYGVPHAHFALSHDEIKVLIEHSKHHYDGVCRLASAKADGAHINGAFTIWQFMTESNAEQAEADRNPYPLEADNRTLQTAIKCLEMPIPTYEAEAGALFYKLVKLLNVMGRESKDWGVEVEIS